MENLNLERPLAFFDLETTGVNVATDRIVEISVLKIFPDQSKNVFTEKVNPTIPIPQQATDVHGISNADVANCPTFAELAPALAEFINDCDLAGFNSNRFDIPLLYEEFLRAGVDIDFKNRRFIDVQNIFHKMEQRTLKAAYKFYCDKDLENAHSAEADIKATYEVLMAQISRYPDLQNDIKFLAEFSTQRQYADLMGRISYNDKGDEVFTFGKHLNKTVESVFEVEPSYYDWMMKGDFPLSTKKLITEIRERMMANKMKALEEKFKQPGQ